MEVLESLERQLFCHSERSEESQPESLESPQRFFTPCRGSE
ncbi:hypothetical protein [Helicobacter marmotae]|nr:hypothetical protein [Helicobacter marmotae]